MIHIKGFNENFNKTQSDGNRIIFVLLPTRKFKITSTPHLAIRLSKKNRKTC